MAIQIADSIGLFGLRGDEGEREYTLKDLRDQIQFLFHKSELSANDTQDSHLNSYRVVCACGDEKGACYYALG